jgi:hypothetical protein
MAVDTGYAWFLRENAAAVTSFFGDDHGWGRLSWFAPPHPCVRSGLASP